MARRIRAPKLENRTSRLKLPVRGKPHFVRISPGIALGYRRNKTAGAWVVRASDGHGAHWTKAFAVADDHEDATGDSVLDYWQALEKARALARGGESNGDRPATVAEAIDAYEVDLKARDGDHKNASRVRTHVPPALAAKAVSLLREKELRTWRAGLIKRGLTPSAADRNARMLKAALALCARDDARITNTAAWRVGLKRLPGTENARNVILPDVTVRAIVAGAHGVSRPFGLLIEVAAVTGARFSQLARLTVADLIAGARARLMVPASRKGKKKPRLEPVPIPATLAAALKQVATGRPEHAPLLEDANGQPWRMVDVKVFRAIAQQAGCGPEVTPYALRHSSIVRQLKAGVPIRIVAAHHDTSVHEIEHSYSRYILTDSDALTRASLLDVTDVPANNVAITAKT